MMTNEQMEKQINIWVTRMSLREKVALLSGKDIWYTIPVERLGIPSIAMTDGPHGVRAVNPETGRVIGPATCFPTGISMAASWNVDLVKKVGAALGEETRGMDCDIILGPCVNIIRSPLGGRNFESYSEDPYLAGRMGVAFVQGVQETGVGTSLKHFACNNYEIERFRASTVVDERTLREIYLPAFETVVKEASPWTVMCAYNRINGVYASQNYHLLTEILREEWGFDGAVVSDWDANHSVTESVRNGLDIEMPGPAKWYGKLLEQSTELWMIEESELDQAVRRILKVILRVRQKTEGGVVNTPEHQMLAKNLAEEAITLLKNDRNVLPLMKEKLKTVAVIGPNAAECRIGGGGSSYAVPPYRISPMEGLQKLIGDQVEIAYEKGCDNWTDIPLPQTDSLMIPGENHHGVLFEFFNGSHCGEKPEQVATALRTEMFWFAASPVEGISRDKYAVRMRTIFTPSVSGLHTFKLSCPGNCKLMIDGEICLDLEGTDSFGHEPLWGEAFIELVAQKPVELTVEFIKREILEYGAIRLGVACMPRPEEDNRISKAVALALEADAVLIFAGMPEGFETEGTDRPHMDLPGRQNELISAVAKANSKTVVVLNVGSPVSMPWLNEVAAVVEAYYPGLEGGNAVANVLFGKVNPSGKLPVTFPVRLEDSPAFINSSYPGAREVFYGEGIFVGYRYYDKKDVIPLFPFGHGLSYTTFDYSNLKIPSSAVIGDTIRISVDITNTGKWSGKEVVQVYVGDEESSLPRPIKELKAFAKVSLNSGETKTVNFELDQRAFAFYQPYKKQWMVEPGLFNILVGSSSRDIRTAGWIELECSND